MSYPTTTGVVAFFADREAASAAARAVAAGGASSVVVHTAIPSWQGPLLGVVRAVGDAAELGPALAGAGASDVYAATFRQVRAQPRTWAVGEQTPGLGALFAISRHPDLDHEGFDAHWRDTHAPLALRHHPGMWDYVQCSFDDALTDDTAPRDGMAICKFASLDDLRHRFFDSDEGRAVIEADIRKFSDVTASPAVRMVEVVLR